MLCLLCHVNESNKQSRYPFTVHIDPQQRMISIYTDAYFSGCDLDVHHAPVLMKSLFWCALG